MLVPDLVSACGLLNAGASPDQRPLRQLYSEILLQGFSVIAMSTTKHVVVDIYPSLFQLSDEAALDAQRKFFLIFLIHLVLLIGSAAAGFISEVLPGHQRLFSFITGLFLILDLVIMFIMRGQRYEQTWFDCRAVAESVKSCAWRYMMGAGPYKLSLPAAHVDRQFLRDLQDILAARPQIAASLAKTNNPGTSVSAVMRDIRSRPLRERIEFYFVNRLQDQRIWYQSKASLNRSRANFWFWLLVVTEVLTAVFVYISGYYQGVPSQLIGVLATTSAAFTAWNQAKRHEELTSAYSLAAQELATFEAMFPHVRDDESQFTILVNDVEEAISREHTMWLARRTVTLRTDPKRINDGVLN